MAVFVCKTVDFVFNTGAIPWTYTLNFSGEHGAAVKSRPNDFVRPLIGVRNPTRHLRWMHVGSAHKAKNWNTRILIQTARHAITRLLKAFAEVDSATIQPRWRARFKAPLWQLQLFQSGRQADGGRIARATRRIVF